MKFIVLRVTLTHFKVFVNLLQV